MLLSRSLHIATRHMSAHARSQKHPLITILGATGTGKSELAVSLARRFNGEIINGDALQLYQGLPIVTNKISPEEQHGIRHHLLGTVPLTDPTWVVSRFTSEVAGIIEDIRARDKIPILVGGTHYYLQTTLFRDALVHEQTKKGVLDATELDVEEDSLTFKDNTFLTAAAQEERWPILAGSPEEIRDELLRVDPVMANRWHPKDHRKIRRSLVIYLQTGRQASEIYAEQEQHRQAIAAAKFTNQSSEIGGLKDTQTESTLRYDNLLFWTYTKLDVLDTRLESRIGRMVDRGLLDEVDLLNEFRKTEEQRGQIIDFTRGIWIAIGYKEFQDYLNIVNRSGEEDSGSNVAEALARGKEKTYFATRQYARQQIKWIRNKLLPQLTGAGASKRLYLLDSTRLSSFDMEVENRAAEITGKWLASEPMPDPESISELAAEVLKVAGPQQPEERSPHTCEHCHLTVMTDSDWANHVRSSKHRRIVKKKQQIARNPYKANIKTRAGGGRVVEAVTDDIESEAIGLVELESESESETETERMSRSL